MVSADFEHASFNIMCCVVEKEKKNNIFGMRLNSVAALLQLFGPEPIRTLKTVLKW